MKTNKIFKLEEVNLPFDELTLNDDELFVIKGGIGMQSLDSNNACNCNCSCSSNSNCNCKCSTTAAP